VRFLLLIVLLVGAGVAVWTAVTNQRIDLSETTSLDGLELDTIRLVDGTSINVSQEGLGSTPFVLLHDFDVAGSILWDQVVAALGSDATVVRIDLPGLGFSQRIPNEDSRHTVASMAQLVASIVEPRFREPVVFGGVGLGGEVAAEIAVSSPDLVAGLVLIDVDFYSSGGWREFVERIPWVGRAATYALEIGGSFAVDLWAPNCETGGWCPSQAQVNQRNTAGTLVGTADSMRAFRTTPASSLVPSKLDAITAPTVVVWSSEGDIPQSAIDEMVAAIPDATLETMNVWKAHLDSPATVSNILWSLAP
jgi:pimeloyl-ACP methyl ester carboxylesterase